MQPRVHVDEEIGPAVLSVFHTARQDVTLVSPYIKLWGHARAAIQDARNRGVRVQCLVRDGESGPRPENVEELLELGVKVLTVPDLHAKIYLNELLVIVGSMNFYNYSAENSREIAVVVSDTISSKVVREYVNRLGRVAHPWADIRSTSVPPPNTSTGRRGVVAVGVCIRCSRRIGFHPDKPLCDDCYESWAEWQNGDYPESYCHSCGNPAATSYARPLCRSCFRAL